MQIEVNKKGVYKLTYGKKNFLHVRISNFKMVLKTPTIRKLLRRNTVHLLNNLLNKTVPFHVIAS